MSKRKVMQQSYRNFELESRHTLPSSEEAKSKLTKSYRALILELSDKGYEILETAPLDGILPFSVLIRGPEERDADKDFSKAVKNLGLPYETRSRYGYYKVSKRN